METLNHLQNYINPLNLSQQQVPSNHLGTNINGVPYCDGAENHKKLPKSASPTRADVFSLDDLMVACTQEIIVNGFETNVVPDSISDWICGKVMRSLPKKLSQRLFSYLIDNRDLEGTVDYKENEKAHVKELTLLVYSNKELKETADSEAIQDLRNKADKSKAETESQNFVFRDREFTGNGLDFYSDEIVIDRQQIVPYLNNKKIEIGLSENNSTSNRTNNSKISSYLQDKRTHFGRKMLKTRKNAIKVGDSEQYSDGSSDIERNDNNSDKFNSDSEKTSDDELGYDPNDQDTKTLLEKTAVLPNNPESCKVCGKYWVTKHNMLKHVQKKHPDYFKENNLQVELNKSHSRNIEPHRCPVCDEMFSNKRNLKRHIERMHPEEFVILKAESQSKILKMKLEKLERKNRPKVSKQRKKASEMEEIAFNPETGFYGCKICAYQSKQPGHAIRHVEGLHRKTVKMQAACHVCGKEFPYISACKKHVQSVHEKRIAGSCEYCGKQFTSESALKKHLYTHTGNPFECEYCGQKFQSRHHMNELHKKSKHPIEYQNEKLSEAKNKNLVRTEIINNSMDMSGGSYDQLNRI